MFSTPILFIVFNRPGTTRAVFEQIRRLRPAKLYVAADGCRPGRADDDNACAEVRAMVTNIDWPCRLTTRFRGINLGCKRAVSDAVNWFFEHEEEGVVLEDDILVEPSFFPFCAAMLERYRSDEAVMHVAGLNVCGCWRDREQEYHFRRFGSIWGWASWRRAWQHYDVEMREWADPAVQRRLLETFFPHELHPARKALYDDLHQGRIDTWDYQWTFSRLLRNGHCVVPARNLVRNIGFGADATHTHQAPRWVPVETFALGGPWSTRSPVVDRAYDHLHLLLSTHNVSLADCQKVLAARGRNPALI